ncbi:TlpA disulfide reductase family protein [Hydrogenophaga pseudoflava]|uniref:TlpA disulfide reductase family protein n=1 Tax=Hydrogenophaga pseudoflava TaxID=47421 RepID=UPI0027E564AB|nr:TlpA disulfide reductase family protein [Hydrogenophaga pseudoflava]MDQ7744300.1 TlpA disulfide reductase family protein [Hydrogenophaga pseudoflava]
MSPPTPLQASSGRRHWLGAAVALATSGLVPHLRAQPAPAAAEEAKAPPLPVLGSALVVPAVDLIGGGRFDPGLARGRPLLVYWWASTCPFCALQSPEMDAFWKAQQGRGLQMLALSIDRTPADAAQYLKKKGYGFPAAWASPAWRQAFPKPRGLPVTLLAGADGRLLVAEKGQMFAEDVQEMARLF